MRKVSLHYYLWRNAIRQAQIFWGLTMEYQDFNKTVVLDGLHGEVPALQYMVFAYFRKHFEHERASELTRQYIDTMTSKDA